MKLLKFLLIAFCFTFINCQDKLTPQTADLGCPNLEGLRILTEAEKSNSCFYLEVYRYKSDIYTLCECCVCDKVAIPNKCSGPSLCDLTENCLFNFYQSAEYLFSVEWN